MSVKNFVTNEKLGERFPNPFALVNYAIGLAKRTVGRGEEFESNTAEMILEMIVDGDDLYDDNNVVVAQVE